jgi:hypothetical protein
MSERDFYERRCTLVHRRFLYYKTLNVIGEISISYWRNSGIIYERPTNKLNF